MTSNYQFPKGTVLNPPVILAGETYSYGFLFDPMPSNRNEGYSIVSGTIQSVVNLGGGQYKIICSRGTQYSSYTKVIPGQGGIEIETQHSTGGNIVASREIDRVISWNNEPMSSMGSVEAFRAVAGDGCQIARSGKSYLWEIISATAYAEAPSQVNYNGESPLPTIGYINSDVNNISITQETGTGFDSFIEGATIVFDETFDQAKYVSAFYFDNSGTLTLGERIHKDEPLPDDFGNGLTGAKYHYNDAYQFRVISDAISFGSDYIFSWMLKDVNNLETIQAGNYFVLQTEQVSSFLTGGDSCLLSGAAVLDSFDLVFAVYHPGCVQWRTSNAADAQSLRMEFDSSGDFAAYKRDAVAGAHSSLSVTQATSYTYPFQVRISKSGTTFSLQSRQLVGDSWEDNASTSFTSMPEETAGIAGVSPTTEDVGFIIGQDQQLTLYSVGDARGTTYVSRFKTGTFAVSKTYPKPATEAITEVYNLSTEQTMSSGGGNRRDRYSLSGSDIVLPSETSGDRIRVTCAAPASLPDAPGNAPRTFLQPDFAEFSNSNPSNPQEASTTVAKNKANWRDSLVIKVEDSGWTPVAGESFTIVRGRGVWSTSQLPTVHIDTRNDNSTNWEALSTSNYHLRAYQGLLLLKKSFADTLTKTFCLKIEGKRYRSGANAQVYNELKHSVEILDNLWFETNIAGGSDSRSVSGMSTGMSVQYGNWACTGDPAKWVAGQAEYGTLAETIRLFQTGDKFPPYWESTEGGVWVTSRLGTTISDESPSTLNCGDPPQPKGEYDYVVPEEEFFIVAPYTDSLAGPIREHWTKENFRITGYVGDVPIVESDLAPSFDNYAIGYIGLGGSFNADYILSAFQYNALPVSIPPEIQRLPDGCTIIDAILSIKFEGMRQRTLSGTYYVDPDGWTYNWTYSEQGTLCESYSRYINGADEPVEESFSVQGLYPEPTQGGSIGFALIGERRNTQFVDDINGDPMPVPDGKIYSLGATVASTVENGKWCVVDATALIRAMYNNRHEQYSNLWLYPTNAQANLSDGTGELADLLDALTPTHSASLVTGDDGTYGFTCSASGKVTWWSNLQIGTVQIKFRLGDSVIDDMVLPLLMPKHLTL